MASVETRAPAAGAMSRRARRAVWGAFVAFFIDSIDINMPVFVLAPAQSYFLSPQTSKADLALFAGMTFGATLAGRPLGSIVFGVLADVIGRKRTTVLAAAGFGTVTLLFAALPGYAQWGIVGAWALLALRFVNGVFLGGEYSAANPLAMEYSPRERRGFYGGLIQGAPPFAQGILSLLTFLLLLVIPAGPVSSPYVQWGWRLPFLAGGLLGLGLAVYYQRSIAESELWRQAGRSASPLRLLVAAPQHRRALLQVFLLMCGVWLAIFPVVGSMTVLLKGELGMSNTTITALLAIGTIAAGFGAWFGGTLSQWIGRRTYLLAIGAINATLSAAAFVLLLNTSSRALGVVLLLVIFLEVSIQGSGALNTVYIAERFHTAVRASAFGLGYSLAIVVGSLYSIYQAGLAHVMPYKYTIIVLLVLGGLLTIVGAAIGPETKDVDMARDVQEVPA